METLFLWPNILVFSSFSWVLASFCCHSVLMLPLITEEYSISHRSPLQHICIYTFILPIKAFSIIFSKDMLFWGIWSSISFTFLTSLVCSLLYLISYFHLGDICHLFPFSHIISEDTRNNFSQVLYCSSYVCGKYLCVVFFSLLGPRKARLTTKSLENNLQFVGWLLGLGDEDFSCSWTCVFVVNKVNTV